MNALQDLKLTVGERATCTAGNPHKGTIVVECIKDFGTPEAYSENKENMQRYDDIVNNPFTYVKVVDKGRFGALTSHWISSMWRKL